MDVFEAVARNLENPSDEDGVAGRFGTSLHAALRQALYMDVDMPLIAFRNHGEIEKFIGAFYKCLNDRLGCRADLVILKNSVDSAQILETLLSASRESNLGIAPVAVPRPGLKKVQGSGKYRSVIAAEVAAIGHVKSRDFADVMGDFLVLGDTNREMINRIDRSLVTIDDERRVAWDLAKTFSYAVMTWMKTSESSLVSDFCFELFDEWSGITDRQLLKRIDEVVPKRKRPASA